MLTVNEEKKAKLEQMVKEIQFRENVNKIRD